MGCGSSSDAAPTPIVPEAQGKVATAGSGGPVSTTQQPAATPSAASSGALPPGLASFKNSAVAGTGSFKGGPRSGPMAGTDEDLPPLKSTPKQRGASLSLSPGSSLPFDLSQAPAGSQIAGLNYCHPDFFPTHMEQTWNHYARPPDYKILDKNGLKAMGEDAVNSFLDVVRKSIVKDNPKWTDQKIEPKLLSIRLQFIPGPNIAECISIATHYFAHELKFAAAGEGAGSLSAGSSASAGPGVTKPCFFLHFQRAYRLLYSYTPGADITLERELIVQKLNKQGAERAAKGLKSLTAKSTNSLMSSKGTKSFKASSRHKSKKDKDKSSSAASEKKAKPAENIFGQLDFGGPPSSGAMAEEQDGTRSQSNK